MRKFLGELKIWCSVLFLGRNQFRKVLQSLSGLSRATMSYFGLTLHFGNDSHRGAAIVHVFSTD